MTDIKELIEASTAVMFFLLSVSIVIISFTALKVARFIYEIKEILGIKKNPKTSAFENSMFAGMIILLVGLITAFFSMPKVAGIIYIIGGAVILISIVLQWILEFFPIIHPKNKEER